MSVGTDSVSPPMVFVFSWRDFIWKDHLDREIDDDAKHDILSWFMPRVEVMAPNSPQLNFSRGPKCVFMIFLYRGSGDIAEQVRETAGGS